ncbi:MAG: DUF371 domain-containing protein [Methanocorpusculum sp.]|nr:DUF371 domain-containing protein [Methanocorpusculum sp.]
MEHTEIIHCRGHANVRALHKSTFEITKEPDLSEAGDCIIAVGADKGAADVSPAFKKALSRPDAQLTAVFSCGGITASVISAGAAGITLTHPTDLVWRRSTFTCPRTIGIYADHTAAQFPRELIAALQTGAEMTVTLTVRHELP